MRDASSCCAVRCDELCLFQFRRRDGCGGVYVEMWARGKQVMVTSLHTCELNPLFLAMQRRQFQLHTCAKITSPHGVCPKKIKIK